MTSKNKKTAFRRFLCLFKVVAHDEEKYLWQAQHEKDIALNFFSLQDQVLILRTAIGK